MQPSIHPSTHPTSHPFIHVPLQPPTHAITQPLTIHPLIPSYNSTGPMLRSRNRPVPLSLKRSWVSLFPFLPLSHVEWACESPREIIVWEETMKSTVTSMNLLCQSTGNLHAPLLSSGPYRRCSQYSLCMAQGLPLALNSHSRDARY